ncbi:EF-P 5-aminopentanol modification-associated protein YfmF [Salibacterium halotolerans]|uniref:Predicted Zn-dependent peptidase n=1 Tax=Salibacterium halotolerans TaxID=1884432 RepID=A0A1I5Y619_9BACI|nr:pitrilysin family protein [Salibacterium halotolerans]SFQ39638.1 Predicted Zn-dependent peptidase [Salibacterium halotolerans]
MLDEQKVDSHGLDVRIIPTEKYKTTTLVLQMKTTLQRKTTAARALLANVLQSATDTHRSRKAIRRYLDELYGASFHADVQRKGEYHVISVKMEIANENFIKNAPPLFQESVSFLQQVLEKPYLPEGSFDKQVINEEKRTLIQRIESIYDDKMRYANKRLIEHMCSEEPFSVHPYGEAEDVEHLTAQDVMDEYRRMLVADDMCLYIVGDVAADDVQKAVSVFSVSKNPEDSSYTPENKTVEPAEEKEIQETDDIQQGKLHLGYRTPVTFADEQFSAMQVMNGMFGGFPNSKLFINVREKESMAYYAASRYESQKGIVLVMAGIEPADYEKASAIIKQQMEDIRQGTFTDDDLEQTKTMLKNQLLETMDHPRGLIELYYQQRMAQHQRPFEDWLKQIGDVTREDVTACASRTVLDTTYFLRNEEDHT